MNEMQWALLVIGIVVVLGVYLHARRQAAKQAVWNNKRKREGMEEDQLDFFKNDTATFDEFGVGKPRTAGERAAPSTEKPAPPRKHDAALPEGLFVISVYRNDLSELPADELHRSLEACGLQFGAHDVYHRFSAQGDPVFSVASMVKPGYLVPSEKQELHTPGVSLFLKLPCALPGEEAFEDLLTTAQSLSDRLECSLLDRQRQPLSIETIAQMRQDCAAYPAS